VWVLEGLRLGGVVFVVGDGGCVGLISSGESTEESAFLDQANRGRRLLLDLGTASPQDVDSNFDVYDAHVCSGSSPCITFPTVSAPPCTTEASCRSAPSPQPGIFGAPASATFSGAGNLAPPVVARLPVKVLTRAQLLAKALKACRNKHNKHKRGVCERQARKRYGPPKSHSKSSSQKGGK
jgi:hypothetical protein